MDHTSPAESPLLCLATTAQQNQHSEQPPSQGLAGNALMRHVQSTHPGRCCALVHHMSPSTTTTDGILVADPNLRSVRDGILDNRYPCQEGGTMGSSYVDTMEGTQQPYLQKDSHHTSPNDNNGLGAHEGMECPIARHQ
jgi:hypothetical protein